MFRPLFLISAFLLLTFSAARADTDTFKQPDLVSFGVGYRDFDKSAAKRQSADFRGEYRWGLSMLPLISPWFKSWDNAVQFHPFAGLEVGSLGQGYLTGGWAMDWYMTKHLIFTWSEGAGLYEGGNAVRLGSFLEFRSQAEFGWRFDNEVRFTAEISHISNAKITKFNPGSEIAGFYLHVPIDVICGKKPQ